MSETQKQWDDGVILHLKLAFAPYRQFVAVSEPDGKGGLVMLRLEEIARWLTPDMRADLEEEATVAISIRLASTSRVAATCSECGRQYTGTGRPHKWRCYSKLSQGEFWMCPKCIYKPKDAPAPSKQLKESDTDWT